MTSFPASTLLSFLSEHCGQNRLCN